MRKISSPLSFIFEMASMPTPFPTYRNPLVKIHRMATRIVLTIAVGAFRVSADSCDLTAEAWPVDAWQNIMRGTSIETCDLTTVGNGRCDYTNNMVSGGCAMDGGDCCLTSCYANCVAKQTVGVISPGADVPYGNPSGASSQCAAMCGVRASPQTNCPYLCLDDNYLGLASNLTGWCTHERGEQLPMSECFGTQDDVVTMLRECLMDDRSHGNAASANKRCGNQTLDCTLDDVLDQVDGCHLHPSACTKESCCTTAITNGWIDPNSKVLPSKCELQAACNADCFATLAQCGRTNKACTGGCCRCNPEAWFGPNCEDPLCWPKCRNGKCVAPGMCYCDPGWSGESCEVPVCSPNCAAGQGVCVAPDVCECFYGWNGDQCETPRSVPPCVHGTAVRTDLCLCESGWGGRLCDYPLCQAYPNLTSDCGFGVCTEPWTCQCEPGWSLTVPVGPDGMDILPTFWKGRDVSGVIDPANFVFGDSRFSQTSDSAYTFKEYNAYRCTTPDCRVITDARCASCAETTAECLKCDAGYFLTGGRCERCSQTFTSCRLCDSSTCLACDPLFSLIDGVCVSDGIFEFSSPIYNALASDPFVEITVIRTVDSLTADWARRNKRFPLKLMVQTVQDVDGGAISQAVGRFSDYQTSTLSVVFPVGGGDVPVSRDELRDQVVLSQTVRIPIYDNMRYDPTVKSFQVRLVADPEAVTGVAAPGGLAYDLPITSAEVFIWDVSTFDYTTCNISPVFLNESGNVTVGTVSVDIPIMCQVCTAEGTGNCTSWSMFNSSTLDAAFVTTSVSSVKSTLTLASTGVFIVGGVLAVPVAVPSVLTDDFSITVQAVFPGVIARQFTFNAVPAPGQAADLARKEHVINQTWTEAQQAPALTVYTGFLHFACLNDGIAGLSTSVGVSLAEGAVVTLTLSGTEIVNIQRPINGSSDPDDVWQAPIDPATVWCGAGLFCNNATSFALDDVLPFTLTFSPSQLFYGRPTGVRLMMLYKQDAVNDPVGLWRVVPQNCLYAPVELNDSPIRGLSVVSN